MKKLVRFPFLAALLAFVALVAFLFVCNIIPAVSAIALLVAFQLTMLCFSRPGAGLVYYRWNESSPN